ncbi:MAG: hypothetical protein U1F58_10765 [Burkholderiales bacterium]
MDALRTSMRGYLYWLLPLAALVVFILWQTEWGTALHRVPPPESNTASQPLKLALLPEYQPVALPEGSRDIVERTLFNPTRRPAPTAAAEAAKPKMQRGQFALAGTLLIDGKASAILRETAGGKSRRVLQGETVNGMLVAEVRPDRVRLTLGDESEELALKLAVGPRTTVQPVVAGAATRTAGATAAGAAPAPTPQVRDVAEVLAERRRAARAAEAAAAGLPPGAPLPGAAPAQPAPQAQAPSQTPPPSAVGSSMQTAPTVIPNINDPNWGSVYQRYQQPRR